MPYDGYKDDLQQFMEAIRVAESRGSGGYEAMGVMTEHGRALGAYGIMSDNWDEWAAQAGIPGADWQDPAAQDRVARYRMTKLYAKYQDWNTVAAAWIGGTGGADDYLAGQKGEPDALGTDVQEYVEKIDSLFSPSNDNPPKADVAGYPGGGLMEGTSQPTRQTARTSSTTSAPSPAGINPQRQDLQDEQLVSAVLETLADQKAGGERVPVDSLEFFPAGEKEEADETGTTVEAAGEEIEAAPTPPAEPTSGGLNSSFESSLQQLISDAPGSVSVSSGYRSVSRQKELWNDALKKYGDPEVADNWVARPGDSFHNHGLAADLDYADEETKQWVHENAAKYGLHFPLSNEDWHVEPVGTR